MTMTSSTSTAVNNNNNNNNNDMFQLRIKSFKDIELCVPAGSVVAHVKQQVRAALQVDNDDEERRNVRLICKGRLLFPDDYPLSDFNVQNGDVLHAVLAPKSTRSTGTVVGPGGRVTRAAVRAGGDDEEDTSSEEDDDVDVDAAVDVEQGGATTTTTTSSPSQSRRRRPSRRERRGFDRLREAQNGIVPMALSRSEVTAIRAYFSRHVDRYMAQQPPSRYMDEEPDPVRRRWLHEEAWMEQQGATSEFRLNLNQNTLLRMATLPSQNGYNTNTRGAGAGGVYYGSISVGTDRDFVWGFLLGFFVGFVMLLWVWMPTVPHKQKIGILAGISFQLAMNVFGTPPPDVEGDAVGVDGDFSSAGGASGSGDYYGE